jgi:dTMP kinase
MLRAKPALLNLYGALCDSIPVRCGVRKHGLHWPRMARGKLIVMEGIDGAGKGTQAELLARALQERGIPFLKLGFPRYESSFGRLIARFLNGEFGPLASVDPHFSALLYAGDRFEAKSELEAALDSGKIVITDRYIASNLAHQTARVSADSRGEFMAWLRRLEYGIYRLPAEDVVIYLRVPPQEGQRLVGLKAVRSYTEKSRDLQESDLSHLKAAALVYDELAQAPNWVTIDCFEPKSGSHRTPEEIHRDVLDAVDSRVLAGIASPRPAR